MTTIKQNPETGCYEVVNGQFKDGQTFYNGRYAGIHSSYWVSEKPRVPRKSDMKPSTFSRKNTPYGFQIEMN